LINQETEISGCKNSQENSDSISDTWNWLSWAIEIGFISNFSHSSSKW
jgi:hypothetical protein